MKSNSQETDFLADIEQVLARHRPFGDYRYIDERTWVHYECRLEMLAEHMPAAGRTLAAFRKANAASRYRVMGDPVVRSTINTALAYFKLGGPEIPLDETKAVLGIAARHFAENSRLAPLAVGARKAKCLGRASYHAWVWCDERDEDIPAQSFRRLFHKQEDKRSVLWTPDEHGHRMLLQGTRLLSELLPKLARSVLNHVHLMVVLQVADRKRWGDERYFLPFDSFSTPIILGTVFLSKVILKDPWHVAESVLHEALHQKHNDLEHTHSMLRPGYNPEYSPRIPAPWNRSHSDNLNDWPVCRAVAAFHVYVHLALFFKAAEHRAPELEKRYGPPDQLDPVLAGRRALGRAHYLGHKIKGASQELGLAGQRFVDWLLEVLAVLDPYPAPDDPHVHLLDLYESETEPIKTLVANWSQLSSRYLHRSLTTGKNTQPARQIMLHLIERELAAAYEVSDLLGGSEPPCQSFLGGECLSVDALSQISDPDLASIFETVRTYVYRSLRMATPRIFTVSCANQPAKTLAQLLQEIVEYSGECLSSYAYLPD